MNFPNPSKGKNMKIIRGVFLALAALTLSQLLLAEEVLQLRKGDVVALCGDSVTEQTRYSLFVGTYLVACQPCENLSTINFGAGGATSKSFLETKVSSHVPGFHPTVATLCYGMNDSKSPPSVYAESMKQIVQILKKNGVRDLLIASPGVVDTYSYTKGNPKPAVDRNLALGELSKIAEQTAKENSLGFTDVHSAMVKAMEQSKAKYGQEYLFAGADGVHPDLNGNLVMAYAMLKGLGCKGDIGTISVDMKSGQATATEGTKVVSYANGQLALESTRYPFCFTGDPALPNSTTGMLEFIPFNQDMNRYLLVVKNPPAASLKIQWGEASKVFTAEQLAAGVNLAAEFLKNPFSEPFAKLQEIIKKQHLIDIQLVGNASLFNQMAENRKKNPEVGGKAFEEDRDTLVEFESKVRANASSKLVPVRHSILIEPAGKP